MKTSLWEIYLDECDSNSSVPQPHRMRSDYFDNLRGIIQAARVSKIPTIGIYNQPSYQVIDDRYDKLLIREAISLLEGKNPDIDVSDYDLLDNAQFALPDDRPLREYFAVVLTGGFPGHVISIKPKNSRII